MVSEQVLLGQRPGIVYRPQQQSHVPAAVLMLHGGGYCWGGTNTHGELAARWRLPPNVRCTCSIIARAWHPYPARSMTPMPRGGN
ncbi:MAG: hypothetical protein R3B90_10280 [Planctomycetaceae bacterium]